MLEFIRTSVTSFDVMECGVCEGELSFVKGQWEFRSTDDSIVWRLPGTIDQSHRAQDVLSFKVRDLRQHT